MKNPDILNAIKALITNPAWKDIVVARLKYILDKNDAAWHKIAKPDDFRYYQGRYDQAKEILDLFKDGSNLAEDGIQTIAPHNGT